MDIGQLASVYDNKEGKYNLCIKVLAGSVLQTQLKGRKPIIKVATALQVADIGITALHGNPKGIKAFFAIGIITEYFNSFNRQYNDHRFNIYNTANSIIDNTIDETEFQLIVSIGINILKQVRPTQYTNKSVWIYETVQYPFIRPIPQQKIYPSQINIRPDTGIAMFMPGTRTNSRIMKAYGMTNWQITPLDCPNKQTFMKEWKALAS